MALAVEFICCGVSDVPMGITQIDAFVDAAEGPFAEATKAEVFGGDFRSYFGEWGVRCRFYGRHGVGVSCFNAS